MSRPNGQTIEIPIEGPSGENRVTESRESAENWRRKIEATEDAFNEEQRKLLDKKQEVAVCGHMITGLKQQIGELDREIRNREREIEDLNQKIERLRNSDVFERCEEIRAMEQEISAAREDVSADAERVRGTLSEAINGGRTAADKAMRDALEQFETFSRELQRSVQDTVREIREEEDRRLAGVRNEVADVIQKEQLAMYKVQYRSLAAVAHNMFAHVHVTKEKSLAFENSTDIAAMREELERQAQNEDLILQNLMRALAKLGIEEIAPAPGTAFDPELHMTETGDEGLITRTKTPGILLSQNGMEEVLMKALVEVEGSAPAD